ncbi:hypothetical protein ACLB2K_024106 [Fragaria x ananassa]
MTAKAGLRSLAAVTNLSLSSPPKPLSRSRSRSLIHSPPNAHHLFDKTSHRDPFEYTRLLFHYTRNDRNHDTISLFVAASRAGLPVNGPVLSSVAKACGSLRDQVASRQVHCQCVKSGLGEDVSVGTSFVDMYMKSSEGVVEGRRVFDEMRERNVVSWTSLISGYAWNGWNEQALELFMEMQASGSMANPFTYVAVPGVLADEGLVGKGEQVHGMVVKNGYVAITDEVTWNTLIAGYVGNGLELEAFEMFCRICRLSPQVHDERDDMRKKKTTAASEAEDQHRDSYNYALGREGGDDVDERGGGGDGDLADPEVEQR